MEKFRKSFQNLIGHKFGKLTVLKFNRRENNRTYWECKCDCGNIIIVRADALKGGQNSCGCVRNEEHRELCRQLGYSRKTHGLCNTRIYRIWAGMKSRCYNPTNKRYKYYGGRGIIICQEWKDNFENFYDWAINNNYADDLTIDRINVNGNYTPDNCRWADWLTQSRNRRNVKKLKAEK